MHLEISVCEIVAIWYGADQLMGPLPIIPDKWSAFELEPIHEQNNLVITVLDGSQTPWDAWSLV